MKSAAQPILNQGKPNKSALHKSEGPFFGIQAKLTVGKPNDKFEKEADAVADKVVNTKEPKQTFFGTQQFFAPTNTTQKTQLQKQEETEEIQEQSISENTNSKVQTAGTDDQNNPETSTLKTTNFSIQREPFDEVQTKLKTHHSTPVIQLKVFESTEASNENEFVQRKEKGTPVVSENITSRIQKAKTQGTPLSKDVRSYMEPRFQTDFSSVRVHNNQEAASLNGQLSARAFTYKNNIFFGKGEYQPETTSGKHLIAHELTHVVQQGHAVQLKPIVKENQSKPQVQRLGISDALDYFADKANHIPGFRMFTILLGLNPINMNSVDRSAANIMRAIVEFLPGGFLITQVLDKYDVFDEAASFMKTQLDSLSVTGSSVKRAIDSFLDTLSWKDIFDLGSVWERAKHILTTPITQIINLGKSVVSAIIDMVKKAVLKPLAILAEGTQGYDLLKALLGEDPITGDPYPATAENVIGGFMKLIGQEEVWQNIVEGNAVAKAWAWFQEAMSGLVAFAKSIPGTIIDALNSLTWEDFVILPNAFIKVGNAFVDIASGYISWAMGTVISLLEILFSVVAPGVLPYIQKAQGAFHSILQNPIGFVSNLVQAAKLGFQQFAAKIGEHLKNSLLNWLLGSLAGAGIYIPQGLNFQEIIKFVASVLGLTWENLRAKLVKHLGEPAVKALEAGFEIVKILVTEGPAAAWEKIMEHLTNLQAMVIQEISQFVIVKVVQNAIAKLVTSLNPAGAVIQAIIAIYQTITFLIDKIKDIAQVGMAVIDSISAIANGVLTEAANKVEKTLAGMLTLAVNFLAKFAGLGKISDAIINIIKKIRQPVDAALDKVVEWLVNTGKKFLKKLAQTGIPEDPQERLDEGMEKAVVAVNKLSGNKVGLALINPILAGIKLRYDFQSLEAVEKGKFWHIKGKINPESEMPTNLEVGLDEENLNIKLGDEISAKYGERNHRAIIQTIDKKKDKVSYEFTYENLKNRSVTLSYDLFKQKIKSGEINLTSGKEHNKYKPDPSTVQIDIVDGVFILNYSYFKQSNEEVPPSFKASVSIKEGQLFTHVVIGKPLSVKPPNTRGRNTARGSNTPGTQRAHLIADWFKGSGYKGALNIINASKEYNNGPMKTAEQEIELGTKAIANKYPNKLITFEMEVDARYYILTDDTTLNAFKSHLDKEEKVDLYKILQNNEDPRLTEKIDYFAYNFKADDASLGDVVVAETGEDKWI